MSSSAAASSSTQAVQASSSKEESLGEMLNMEDIQKIMDESGPRVQTVIIQPQEGQKESTISQLELDMTPSENKIVEAMGGSVTILGQYNDIDTVVLKLRNPGENAVKNPHKLQPPLHNQVVYGPLLMVRMDADANPQDFTKQEYLEYLKKDIEPFEISDQPVGPSGEPLQENQEDEEEDEYDEDDDDDEEEEEDDDEEEGDDDEEEDDDDEEDANDEEMIHMVILNKVMEQFKEQHGREPSEDELKDILSSLNQMSEQSGEGDGDDDENDEQEDGDDGEENTQASGSKRQTDEPAQTSSKKQRQS
eukprot:gb/GECG01005569.1/.p1 GENE.gb/GECG01005569.1/~~gb/GECG01005569.1/.p1  ORF type:complete len:306 (+),score=98.45 gb/GECG01005569.1/:1-918(+)